MVGLVSYLINTDTSSENAARVELMEKSKIEKCEKLGGIPSVEYRSFGYPTEKLTRCDLSN